ncbi:hypothetical protein M7I_6414 [Glarea lozoyensis 74030]|uniref:Clr5 domain-containing protein n=1 Tax=Glarea lozoyensis (strain ATCC 74030 / MF5533) TaxID=1104152 RepID=H0EUF7_GLAL7|nr:hypothetical protein M7I_6414 [Glarea lozoyensis 74030]
MSRPNSSHEWDRFKNIIYDLYIVKKYSLEGPKGVMKVMEDRYNFKATKAQYEKKLRDWGFQLKDTISNLAVLTIHGRYLDQETDSEQDSDERVWEEGEEGEERKEVEKCSIAAQEFPERKDEDFLALVQFLLDKGAAVNPLTDDSCNSPAVGSSEPPVYDDDIDHILYYRHSPLTAASRYGNVYLIEIFLENHANVRFLTGQKTSALHVEMQKAILFAAISTGDNTAIKYIFSYSSSNGSTLFSKLAGMEERPVSGLQCLDFFMLGQSSTIGYQERRR